MAGGDLAIVERSQGEQMMAPITKAKQFSEGISRHHRPFYDDYDVAKAHVLQAVGDLSDLDIFGRQVLVAVFCRPNTMMVNKPDGTRSALYLPMKEIKEDWYQHKVVLILKCGPDAFSGDDSYMAAMFGDDVPKPKAGEWVFANASAGIQINLAGEGASRPQGVDARGEPMDIFEWDGWPCRIIGDENFLGRLMKPHSIV